MLNRRFISFYIVSLFASLVLVISLHVWLGPNCSDFWKCPAQRMVLNDNIVAGSTLSSFDFSAIELPLSRLSFDPSGNIVLDASAESSLSIASSALTKIPSPQHFQHIKFLLMKSFPSGKSDQIIAVFEPFVRYIFALQEDMTAAKSSAGNSYQNREKNGASDTLKQQLLLLARKEVLQRTYLGDVLAPKLYGQQNALARELIDLQLIEADDSLSNYEKQRRSLVIEKAIERIMSEPY